MPGYLSTPLGSTSYHRGSAARCPATMFSACRRVVCWILLGGVKGKGGGKRWKKHEKTVKSIGSS